MAKRRRRTAEEDQPVECTLRVVTKSGKIVIEIDIADEEAAIALAAKLLRQAG